MVNVLLAQKLHHHLVHCAMNRETTWFNAVHDLIHGTHPETSEAEVQETNDTINGLANWLRSKNLPRLTVLINSSNGAVGVGNGFWKNCGLTVSSAHYEPVYKLLVQECYAYYTGFCGFNQDLQDHVLRFITAARNDESVNSAEIFMVVSEQVEYFSRASTSHEQIHLDFIVDKLIPKSLHKEFFIRMAAWFEQAAHENDGGLLVWDMDFLRGAVRKLRREFTITLPINQPHNLFSLTLARELKDGEAYMATIDEINLLTVATIEGTGPAVIEHIELKDGRMVQGPGNERTMRGIALAGNARIHASADREQCTFSCNSDGHHYTHVTMHVSFRMQ